MNELIIKIDDITWGPLMIAFLLGTHIYLTYKTRFVQKHVFTGIKLSFQKEKSEKGELSVFGSLMAALSSTIGTGNIIGTSLGIIKGGPGAVLWMLFGGIFGIATKYAESLLAVRYRHRHSNGQYSGGPMVIYEKLGKPAIAKFCAVLCALCAFGIGCATQSDAIADSLYETFGFNKIVVGLVVALLTALVIFGGLKSIANVCSALVPFMSVVYIVGCLAILIINRNCVGQAAVLIIQSAFTPRAAVGGFVGSTIATALESGVARGLFSNEAGMGSAPQATAASVANNSVKPALIASTGVFLDTCVVCTITGLVLVSTIIANDSISCILADGTLINKAALVSQCFGQIPVIGTPLLVFGILTFAFSTILGWAYYGENSVRYLFGHKGIKVYQVLWVIVAFLGVIVGDSIVWVIADILNGLMCIPNCITLWICRNQIAAETRFYLNKEHLDDVDPKLE